MSWLAVRFFGIAGPRSVAQQLPIADAGGGGLHCPGGRSWLRREYKTDVLAKDRQVVAIEQCIVGDGLGGHSVFL